MVASSRARAFSKRLIAGSGSLSRYSENGSSNKRNIWRTLVIASPISDASDCTSALNNVFATTDNVRCGISVEISSALPAVQRSRHRTAHCSRITGQPLAMERRLNQSALPQMMLSFAGEQSLTQQNLRKLQSAALDE